ncbi:MAG: ABC transporter permease [Faecalibacterium sp.]|nr:ABC transporter permease [Faecalibacterium sp.]
MNTAKRKPLSENPAFISVLASLLSIVIGLVLGFVLLLLLNAGAAGEGMMKMLTTGFGSLDKLGKVLYQAAPLMLCGLSVGFAFKTGLFNIGASGQYTIGAFFALVCAIQFQMPWYLCLLASTLGGAIWGLFPGLFKALFNVNEVITSIMFNWIGMYLVNLVIANMPMMLAAYWGASNSDRTAALKDANPSALIPKCGLDKLFNSSWINISIFITIVVALIVWVILQKTTFGYELKACGMNKFASKYAGINANRNIVLSMVIAGALSGLGGGLYYLAGTVQYVMEKSILGMGFNGIPVALLANSNPLGTIFSALFVSYIQVGGAAMQPDFSSETTDIVIAVIIYLAAFSLLMRGVIAKALTRRKEKEGTNK